MSTFAPASTAPLALLIRSVPTQHCATFASSRGSSPTIAALWTSGRRAAARRARRRHIPATGRRRARPSAINIRASASAVGVLPAPPATKLPTQMVGAPSALARLPHAPRGRCVRRPSRSAEAAGKQGRSRFAPEARRLHRPAPAAGNSGSERAPSSDRPPRAALDRISGRAGHRAQTSRIGE